MNYRIQNDTNKETFERPTFSEAIDIMKLLNRTTFQSWHVATVSTK